MLMKGCKAGVQQMLHVPSPSVVVSTTEEQQRFPVVPRRVFLLTQQSSTVSHQSSCQGGPQHVTRSSHPQEIHTDDSLSGMTQGNCLPLIWELYLHRQTARDEKPPKALLENRAARCTFDAFVRRGKVQRRSPKQHQKQHPINEQRAPATA